MPLLAILALACFSTSLIIRVTDPLIPDIARDLSSLPATVALIASAFAFPYALGQPLLGPLGDALGKARVIKACLAVVAVGMALAAVAPSLETLFAARILAGLAAGGVIPVGLALVGDRFEMHDRQVALSRLLAAMLFGQILGAIGSGVIGTALGWRAVMAVGACIVAAALALTVVKLEPRPNVVRQPFRLAGIRAGYAQVFANARAKICYTAVFVEGVCILGLVPYLAVLLEERGAGGVREAGFVLAGLGTGGILFSVLVRWLLRRLGGQMNVMRAGGVIAGLGLGLYSIAPGVATEAAAFVVLGLGFYMLHNSLQTQATELAPAARGAAVALHASCFFAGQAVGPIAYRFGIGGIGATKTVLIAAVCMTAIGFWTARFLERHPARARF
jgi:predicted MFS family arabinose efflux permease